MNHDDAAPKEAALRALAGPKLASGKYRDVYGVKDRPDAVLKLEERPGQFCNVMEWKLWHRAIGTAAATWLAPCIDVGGAGGRALIMRRTEPMTDDVWATLEGPEFFNDVVPENWGLLDGRPVCHDYADCELLTWQADGQVKRAATPTWLGRRFMTI